MSILTEDDIIGSLSNLGYNAETCSHAYLDANLPQKNLKNVDALKQFRCLQNVHLQENKLEDVKALGSLVYLRKLNVSSNNLTSMLDFGAQHPRSVEDVDLGYNRIERLDNLERNRFIRRLVLSGNQLTSLEGIAQLPYLTHLAVENNKITDLSPVTNGCLQHLLASGNAITSLRSVSSLPALTVLDVSRNGLTSLDGVAQLPALATLLCASNALKSVAELKKLAKLPLLRDLDVRDNPLQDKRLRLEALFTLPRLQRLDQAEVKAEEVVDAANAHGAEIPHKEAIFSYFMPRGEETTQQDVAPYEYTFAATRVPLPEAHFWNMIIERGFLGVWEQFSALYKEVEEKELDLSGVPVGEVGAWALAQAVAENPRVESFNLEAFYNPYRWTSQLSNLYGVAALFSSLSESRLRQLNLTSCYLGRHAGVLLARLVQKCETLEKLVVADNFLGEHIQNTTASGQLIVITPAPGLKALLTAALSRSRLAHLDVARNRLDERAAGLLAAFVAHANCPARTLVLDENALGAEGTRQLADALKTNTSIVNLALRKCIPRELAPYLARSLAKYNDTVQSLDLSGTPLDAAGAKAVASLLHRDLRYRSSSSVLRALRLVDTGLSSEDVISLAGSLQDNSTLQVLGLPISRSLTREALETVLNAVAAHPELQHLEVVGQATSSLLAPRLAELTRRGVTVTHQDQLRASQLGPLVPPAPPVREPSPNAEPEEDDNANQEAEDRSENARAAAAATSRLRPGPSPIPSVSDVRATASRTSSMAVASPFSAVRAGSSAMVSLADHSLEELSSQSGDVQASAPQRGSDSRSARPPSSTKGAASGRPPSARISVR